MLAIEGVGTGVGVGGLPVLLLNIKSEGTG